MAEDYLYELDITGQLPANKVVDEDHTVQPSSTAMNPFIIPQAAPFFETGLKVYQRVVVGVTTEYNLLTKGVDYQLTHKFVEASAKLGKNVYGGIAFINHDYSGLTRIEYQTLGGAFTLDNVSIVTDLTQRLYDLRTVTWDQIEGVPESLPPISHQQPLEDLAGFEDFVLAMQELVTAVENANPDESGPAGSGFPQGTLANPWILTSSDDLDNKIDPGIYIAGSTTVTDTARNFPATGVTGYLEVSVESGPNLKTQVFKQMRDPGNVVNNGHGNIQSEWKRLALDDGNGGFTFTAWERSDVASLIAQAAGVPTGMVSDYYGRTAPTGWLAINGGTIGNAASGATQYANADARELFKLIWQDFDNLTKPIQNDDGSAGSRGANADADFDAGKRLPLNDDRGLHRRTWDDRSSGALDVSRELHSYQEDMIKSHGHDLTGTFTYGLRYQAWGEMERDPGGAPGGDNMAQGLIQIEATGGVENRVKNRAYLTIVKL